MGIRTHLGIVGALAGVCLAGAGEPLPSSLSLAQARELALQRNPDLRSAEAQVEAAAGALQTARQYPNPTLGLSTSKISSQSGTAAGNGFFERSYDTIASLSQLILVAKRGLQRQSAEAGVRQAQSLRDDSRRLLLQSVTVAYISALSARQQADVLIRSARQLRQEADIASHRYQAGDISAADRSRIEVEAAQDELAAEAQRAAASAAVIALETLLADPAPQGATQLTDTLDSITAAAVAGSDLPPVTRPDVAAAEAAVEQAEANLSLQRRQNIPDVTLSVQYERNPPAPVDSVGLGLSLPLPLWNRNGGGIASARAARDQSQAQLDKARAQAASDLASARVAYAEAAARARRYREAVEPESAKATGSVSYAYGKGGASLVDLLEAERSDNQVRIASVQAQADTATAAVNLLSALGHLP